MANCRKCGAKKITKREAGVFFCQHCGMQPGELGMDRMGNVPDRADEIEREMVGNAPVVRP